MPSVLPRSCPCIDGRLTVLGGNGGGLLRIFLGAPRRRLDDLKPWAKPESADEVPVLDDDLDIDLLLERLRLNGVRGPSPPPYTCTASSSAETILLGPGVSSLLISPISISSPLLPRVLLRPLRCPSQQNPHHNRPMTAIMKTVIATAVPAC